MLEIDATPHDLDATTVTYYCPPFLYSLRQASHVKSAGDQVDLMITTEALPHS
jgi:hypothetical protein